MPHKKRTDGNQKDIIAAARKVGAFVVDLSAVGGGCPDLLIGFRGKNFLFEIKMPGKEKRLTKDQIYFHAGFKGKLYVVSSVEEVINILFSG